MDDSIASNLAQLPGSGRANDPHYARHSTISKLLRFFWMFQAWRRSAVSLTGLARAVMSSTEFDWLADHWGGLNQHGHAREIIFMYSTSFGMNISINQRIGAGIRGEPLSVQALMF
jgi:hypothetical protein